VSHQSPLKDFQRVELNTKRTEDLITHARDAIAKAQALLDDNEWVLEQEKRRMEELSDKNKLDQRLEVESSAVEALQAEYAMEISLTEEEMQAKVMATAEETHQQEIQSLKDQIKSLAR